MFTQLKDKYFETKNLEAITLGAQAGLLALLISILDVIFEPQRYYLIATLMGVLVLALLQTIALRGSFERRLRYTLAASILIALGMGFGSYLGDSCVATTLVLLLLIPLVAYSSGADHLIASTILFSTDLFIVGSGMPATTWVAIGYGISFAIGGILTWLLAFIWNKYFPISSSNHIHYKPLTLARVIPDYYKYHRFALVLTVAVTIGNTISYAFHLPQGYWVPMTAMLILKADFDFAKKRINHRLYGTLLGSIAAFLVILLISSKLLLALLMLPLMFLMVIALAKHYGSYTFFLTIAVTVMLNLIEPVGYMITEHRIIDTLLGILAVLLVVWLIKPKIAKKLD